MIVVMGVMAASALFVAAAFAAANGDLPLTRDSQDRKQAYAAAEAGINYYQYHLNQDPDYWTQCTNVPAPNATENQPVNQEWNGTGTDRPAPLAQGGRARRPSTRSSCCRPTATPSCVENNLTHDDRLRDEHVQDPLDRPPARGHASSSAASSRRSAAARSSTSSTSPTSRRRTRSTTRRDQPGVGAGELRRQVPRAARQRLLQRDPVRRRGRDQRPAAHQRRHPHLRHADVRPQQRGLDRDQRPGAGLHEGRRQRLRRRPGVQRARSAPASSR